MSLSRLLRQVVSGDSIRFQDDDFDLNLTYITPRIIGMGFPASGVEGMFRNSIVEVSQFLLEKHQSNFMVYNLSERAYDYSLFHNQVLDFGFPDHHNPPLLLMLTIIRSIHSWLSADPANVVAVHCLAGKGRTGTVIACYLIYAGLIDTPEEALAFYASRRSHISKGVTRPSQKRYVQYFHAICSGTHHYQGLPKVLQRVEFGPAPWMIPTNGGIFPVLDIFEMRNNSLPTPEEETPVKVVETCIYHSTRAQLEGSVIDNYISFHTHDIVVIGDINLRVLQPRMWKETPLLRISFHTSFIPENNVLHFSKSDIGLADRDERFDENFEILMFFEDCRHEITLPEGAEWDDDTFAKFLTITQTLRQEARENNSFLHVPSE